MNMESSPCRGWRARVSSQAWNGTMPQLTGLLSSQDEQTPGTITSVSLTVPSISQKETEQMAKR